MSCFAVIDIGSAKNLGWSILYTDRAVEGLGPTGLIEAVVEAVMSGPLYLGFEAPMYVPARRDGLALLKARPGEGSRPWSAGAGTGAMAAAQAVVPWILDGAAAAVPEARGWQDWHRLPTASGEILVFEAFVSGGASDGHIEDAREAAQVARSAFEGAAPVRSALADEPCSSPLGAALLRSGLSNDLAELRRPCLVVRAAKRLTGATPPRPVNRP